MNKMLKFLNSLRMTLGQLLVIAGFILFYFADGNERIQALVTVIVGYVFVIDHKLDRMAESGSTDKIS